MARKASPEPDFDRELADLPPELRWREWKARVEAVLFAAPRARDNLAAIRLMTAIEAEGRHARPDEQEQLAKFTAFGATDLAD
jgi:hypothetical protein